MQMIWENMPLLKSSTDWYKLKLKTSLDQIDKFNLKSSLFVINTF